MSKQCYSDEPFTQDSADIIFFGMVSIYSQECVPVTNNINVNNICKQRLALSCITLFCDKILIFLFV
jgi:hypothetical protein